MKKKKKKKTGILEITKAEPFFEFESEGVAKIAAETTNNYCSDKGNLKLTSSEDVR